MAELEDDSAPLRRRPGAPRKRRDDARAGPPYDVKARHGIAVSDRVVAAALRPADHRKELDASIAQPGSLLAGGESDVSLRPPAWPMVLHAVEAGCPHPIGQREFVAVANAHPALFGRIDQKDAAERPERLAAERGLRLLVEQEHFPAGVGEFIRRDEPGEPSADDEGVGGFAHGSAPGVDWESGARARGRHSNHTCRARGSDSCSRAGQHGAPPGKSAIPVATNPTDMLATDGLSDRVFG